MSPHENSSMTLLDVLSRRVLWGPVTCSFYLVGTGVLLHSPRISSFRFLPFALSTCTLQALTASCGPQAMFRISGFDDCHCQATIGTVIFAGVSLLPLY